MAHAGPQDFYNVELSTPAECRIDDSDDYSSDADPIHPETNTTPRSVTASDLPICTASPRSELLWDHSFEKAEIYGDLTILDDSEHEWRKFNKTDDDKLNADKKSQRNRINYTKQSPRREKSSDMNHSPRSSMRSSVELPDLISSMSSSATNRSPSPTSSSMSGSPPPLPASDPPCLPPPLPNTSPPPLPTSSPPPLPQISKHTYRSSSDSDSSTDNDDNNNDVHDDDDYANDVDIDNNVDIDNDVEKNDADNHDGDDDDDDSDDDDDDDDDDEDDDDDDDAMSRALSSTPEVLVDDDTYDIETAVLEIQNKQSDEETDSSAGGDNTISDFDDGESSTTEQKASFQVSELFYTGENEEIDIIHNSLNTTDDEEISNERGDYDNSHEPQNDSNEDDMESDDTNISHDNISMDEYMNRFSELIEFAQRDSEDNEHVDEALEAEFEAILHSLDMNFAEETYIERFAGRRDRYGFILSPITERPTPSPSSSVSGYSGLSSTSPDPFSVFRMSPCSKSGDPELDLSTLQFDRDLDPTEVPIYRAKKVVIVPEGFGWDSEEDILSGSGEWDSIENGLSSPPVSTTNVTLSQFGRYVRGWKQPDGVIIEEGESSENDSDTTVEDNDVGSDSGTLKSRDGSCSVSGSESDECETRKTKCQIDTQITEVGTSKEQVKYESECENEEEEDDASVSDKLALSLLDEDLDEVENILMHLKPLTTDRSDTSTENGETTCTNGKGVDALNQEQSDQIPEEENNERKTTTVLRLHSADSFDFSDTNIENEYNEDAEDEYSETETETECENKESAFLRTMIAQNVEDGDCICVKEVLTPRSAVKLVGSMLPDSSDSDSSPVESEEDVDEVDDPNMSSYGSGVRVTQYTSDSDDSRKERKKSAQTDTSQPSKSTVQVSFRKNPGCPKLNVRVSTKGSPMHIISPLDFSLFKNIAKTKPRRSPRVFGRYYDEFDDDILSTHEKDNVEHEEVCEKNNTLRRPFDSEIFKNSKPTDNLDEEFQQVFLVKSPETVTTVTSCDSSDEDEISSCKVKYISQLRNTDIEIQSNGCVFETAKRTSDKDEHIEEPLTQTDHEVKSIKLIEEQENIRSIANSHTHVNDTIETIGSDIIEQNTTFVKQPYEEPTNKMPIRTETIPKKPKNKAKVHINVGHLGRTGSARLKVKKGFVHELSALFSQPDDKNKPKCAVQVKHDECTKRSETEKCDVLLPNENITFTEVPKQETKLNSSLKLLQNEDKKCESLGFEVTPFGRQDDLSATIEGTKQFIENSTEHERQPHQSDEESEDKECDEDNDLLKEYEFQLRVQDEEGNSDGMTGCFESTSEFDPVMTSDCNKTNTNFSMVIQENNETNEPALTFSPRLFYSVYRKDATAKWKHPHAATDSTHDITQISNKDNLNKTKSDDTKVVSAKLQNKEENECSSEDDWEIYSKWSHVNNKNKNVQNSDQPHTNRHALSEKISSKNNVAGIIQGLGIKESTEKNNGKTDDFMTEEFETEEQCKDGSPKNKSALLVRSGRFVSQKDPFNLSGGQNKQTREMCSNIQKTKALKRKNDTDLAEMVLSMENHWNHSVNCETKTNQFEKQNLTTVEHTGREKLKPKWHSGKQKRPPPIPTNIQAFDGYNVSFTEMLPEKGYHVSFEKTLPEEGSIPEENVKVTTQSLRDDEDERVYSAPCRRWHSFERDKFTIQYPASLSKRLYGPYCRVRKQYELSEPEPTQDNEVGEVTRKAMSRNALWSKSYRPQNPVIRAHSLPTRSSDNYERRHVTDDKTEETNSNSLSASYSHTHFPDRPNTYVNSVRNTNIAAKPKGPLVTHYDVKLPLSSTKLQESIIPPPKPISSSKIKETPQRTGSDNSGLRTNPHLVKYPKAVHSISKNSVDSNRSSRYEETAGSVTGLPLHLSSCILGSARKASSEKLMNIKQGGESSHKDVNYYGNKGLAWRIPRETHSCEETNQDEKMANSTVTEPRYTSTETLSLRINESVTGQSKTNITQPHKSATTSRPDDNGQSNGVKGREGGDKEPEAERVVEHMQSTSLHRKTPKYQHVLEDERGNLKLWPYSDFEDSDKLPVTLHRARKGLKVIESKDMLHDQANMTLIQSAQHSSEAPDNRTVKKYHSSTVIPSDESQSLMRTHGDSVESVLFRDTNGNTLTEEELASIMPRLAASVANMKEVDVEEILPGITQSVTKLKNGGNLVITTMTRKIDEDESDSSGRGSPVANPVLNVEDLENSRIYLVQDSKGEMFYVEDVTSETQESAYYSSTSRHNSESISDAGSSPSTSHTSKISKIRQVGESGINESTAEEILSAMYDQNDGIQEITENEEEWSERTYEYDFPRRRQNSATGSGGYSKESFNTSYMVEEPDTLPKNKVTTKDRMDTSYEMTATSPWVYDGGSGAQNFSVATHGIIGDGVESMSTVSINDQNNLRYSQATSSLANTGVGITRTTERFTIDTEEVPEVPMLLPQAPLPQPPFLVQADNPQYSLVKVDVAPRSIERVSITPPSIVERNKPKEVDDKPIYKTVAHIQTGVKQPPEKSDMTEKKYMLVSSSASPISSRDEEVQESRMSLDEVDYKFSAENVEYKMMPQHKQVYMRNSTHLDNQERFRSEKRIEMGNGRVSDQRHKTNIRIQEPPKPVNDLMEESNYSYDEMKAHMENSETSMRVIRGSYLIKNNLEEVDTDLDDNINMFDGKFTLCKDNPLYQSDEDLYRKWGREKQEKQDRIQRDINNDLTFETVDRYSRSKKVQREEERRPKQSMHELLLTRLSSIDQTHIRSKVDVKHHSEDIYGDPRYMHADGSSDTFSETSTNNFESVGEKVDLLIKEGKAYITIIVTAEKVTPIDLEFNVWRKNQAIVTRTIEIDLLATEQRRRLYYKVMEEPGSRSLYRGGRSETVLDSEQTLNVFTRILGAADGEGDNEDITVRTSASKTTRPLATGIDLLY